MNENTTPKSATRTRIRRGLLAGVGALGLTAVTVFTPALAEPAAAAWYDYLPLSRGFNCRWLNIC